MKEVSKDGVILVLWRSVTACKKEAKSTDSATTEKTTENNGEASASNENASSDLPKFSSPEIQKFAEDYSAFINETAAAAKSGDVAKIQELTKKAQEWATKSQTEMAKMTPEDAKLWTEYYTKLSQKMMNP